MARIRKPKPLVMSPPSDLDFEKALMFFHAYMYGPLQGKLRLYLARDIHGAGKVLPSDWEVFASILVRDEGTKRGKGTDLKKYEVKSAEKGGSFEYQYHKDTGKQKLDDDSRVGHLFFSHSDNLKRVELRFVTGKKASKFFDKWKAEYPDPYPQRYRKSIPNKWVKDNGTLIMRLIDGEIDFPKI
ncbi:MAG: hypothetical protein HYX26_03770 [Acidobacteriales bacterium]|nr:hypothetical protein [Terriglobales bacterium]